MSADCLFCRIVAGEIPATVVRDTERVLAFRDIAPQAPTHVVVIPKAHHIDVAALSAADPALAGELLATVSDVAAAEGLAEGWRVVFNTGRDGGQTVFHVHAHLLGGRGLSWPPG
jgi:histidine triad (HIT) family protein